MVKVGVVLNRSYGDGRIEEFWEKYRKEKQLFLRLSTEFGEK